ncbi:Ribosome biogenesis protein Brix [Spironucleus salmonicida]|uniref:Ribosome biogenesis protein Brix n=1 Tax=Spironucleus salmonicida TaxID=348837 RepID=V6LS25_9EUKA|nr:Ribosome biogenesis protein Brix [Spironucleus salmonicida]|eukprot:EST47462.1 Ribosome biogenesis protein Brix [Spironucleus salmonicida]
MSKHVWSAHQVLSIQNSHIIGDNSQFKQDIERLCPHAKPEQKFNDEDAKSQITVIARQRNCDSIAFFETKRFKDLFLYLATTSGPTLKLQVIEKTTQNSVKFDGDFFVKTRPLLNFDASFDDKLHLRIAKELFKRQFSTPNLHYKSAPFVDHLIQFTVVDKATSRIEMRVFSFDFDPLAKKVEIGEDVKLKECGPFVVFLPVSVYSGALSGDMIWKNEKYATPGMASLQKKKDIVNQVTRREVKRRIAKKQPKDCEIDPIDAVFTEAGFVQAFQDE